jgi:hypothetical protein
MDDDTFKRILQDKQFHLQIKAEQKEIIQNVLERKDSMAECYQRASERACATSPLKSNSQETWKCADPELEGKSAIFHM